MNAKRVITTIIAAFVAVWATDFLIHQVILQKDYIATKELWRSEADMLKALKWLMLGELMAATGLAILWLRGFAATAKPACALGFGVFAGLLGSSYAPIFYAVMPLPGLLCVKWVVCGVLQSTLVSLLLYALTRPRKA